MDERTLISFIVTPVGTIAFTAIMLGLLRYQARRHGFSIFKNLGAYSWVVAIYLVAAGGFFSSVIVLVLITPYNFPLDWTPTIIWGFVDAGLGILLFLMAYRTMMRHQTLRRQPTAA